MCIFFIYSVLKLWRFYILIPQVVNQKVNKQCVLLNFFAIDVLYWSPSVINYYYYYFTNYSEEAIPADSFQIQIKIGGRWMDPVHKLT